MVETAGVSDLTNISRDPYKGKKSYVLHRVDKCSCGEELNVYVKKKHKQTGNLRNRYTYDCLRCYNDWQIQMNTKSIKVAYISEDWDKVQNVMLRMYGVIGEHFAERMFDDLRVVLYNMLGEVKRFDNIREVAKVLYDEKRDEINSRIPAQSEPDSPKE